MPKRRSPNLTREQAITVLSHEDTMALYHKWLRSHYRAAAKQAGGIDVMDIVGGKISWDDVNADWEFDVLSGYFLPPFTALLRPFIDNFLVEGNEPVDVPNN